VINAVETGKIPAGGKVTGKEASYGPIVQHVIGAAYGAFHEGLGTALLTSAILIFTAGVLSACFAGRSQPVSETPAPIPATSSSGA